MADDPTFNDKLNLLKAGFAHAEKIFELQSARLDAIGRFNIAIADARIKHAKANGMFLDNRKKAWRLEELRALKAEFNREIKTQKSAAKRLRLRNDRAFSLHAGDRMTENVQVAWQSLYEQINQAPRDEQQKLSALPFDPECADPSNFRLMNKKYERHRVPYNPLIPINSLETLAARLRFYHYAPHYGSAPHSLVVDGLGILMPPADIKLNEANEALKTAEEELEKLARDIASGKAFGDLPDPKKPA